MVLSHIYTAQNLHAEAGKHINLLVNELGNEGLHWLIDTQAAATPVAQNMLHGTQGPYR